MPTRRDVLDAGMPAPTEGQDPTEARAAALAYGRAYGAVIGTPAAPTGYGSFHRRVGETLPRRPVIDNQCLVEPSMIGAVQEVGGEARSLRIVLTRQPSSGEVLLTPQADGTQLLTFYAEDSIEVVAVYLLLVPAAMVAALDADT